VVYSPSVSQFRNLSNLVFLLHLFLLHSSQRKAPAPVTNTVAGSTVSQSQGTSATKPNSASASFGNGGGGSAALSAQETQLMGDMLDTLPGVTWNDIAGLTGAKQTMQETVILPNLRPDIFTGLRAPPRGVLLYGPPGEVTFC